jgi:hypothetical protein
MLSNKRLLAASFLAISPFAAHAVETTYVFDSVSAVRESNSNFSITGILAGDSTPTTLTTPTSAFPTERCDRRINLALSQPGTYTLTLTIDRSYVVIPPGTTSSLITSFVACTLELKP